MRVAIQAWGGRHCLDSPRPGHPNLLVQALSQSLQEGQGSVPSAGSHLVAQTPQVDRMPLFSPLTLRNSAMLEKYFWLASATFFSAA